MKRPDDFHSRRLQVAPVIASANFAKDDSRNDAVTDLLQQKDYGIGTSVRIQQLNWYLPLQARLTTL